MRMTKERLAYEEEMSNLVLKYDHLDMAGITHAEAKEDESELKSHFGYAWDTKDKNGMTEANRIREKRDYDMTGILPDKIAAEYERNIATEICEEAGLTD